MPPPDRAPTRRVRRLLAPAAALLPLVSGCGGDSLYDAGEVTGPNRTLASHSVALSVPRNPTLAVGETLPVTVSFEALAPSGGVSRLGATALLIGPSGADTTVLRARETISPPALGSGSATLEIRVERPDSRPLPGTFRLEVSAFAVAANGACAAAVAPAPQRLGCATLRGDTVAFGVSGARREVTLGAPLSVSLTASVAPRADEGTPLVEARATARANPAAGPITAVGITGLFFDAAGTLLAVLSDSTAFPSPPSGSALHSVSWTAADVARSAGRVSLLDSLSVELHAFARHGEGECVATVAPEPLRLACASRGGATVSVGSPPVRLPTRLVKGRSVRLPDGAGRVVDLAVDPRTDRAYLSNLERHRIEVLDLRSMTFLAPIEVGSQPAGIALNRTGDTLLVANSGGISISFVPTSTLREDLPRRFEIPRVRLYEVNELDHRDAVFHSFTDRPMFVEQDAAGRLLYTTVTTEEAPVGTIRAADWASGWTAWEPYLLFHQRQLKASSGWTAVANVDSILLLGKEEVLVFDHVPGFPDRTLRGGPGSVREVIAELRARGSDALAVEDAQWDVPKSVELSDTGFVTVSGDRRVALFGEGVRTPAGRLLLWSADAVRISDLEDVADVAYNTSDRIRGIDLNQDGTLGAARGERGIYFFGEALRLRGTAADPGGGAGIGLLPGGGGTPALAFAGTAGSTIRVIETTHFRPLGELPIRARIVGPLEMAAPLPGANAGRACSADPLTSDPGCAVARLVAVTEGGVTSLEIRAGDLQSLAR